VLETDTFYAKLFPELDLKPILTYGNGHKNIKFTLIIEQRLLLKTSEDPTHASVSRTHNAWLRVRRNKLGVKQWKCCERTSQL